MLTKRIIACMDVRDGQVVKGVQFQQLRHAGDPAELARRYNVEGIDEVVVLDITATLESRQALAETISAVAHRIFLPLTVLTGMWGMNVPIPHLPGGADAQFWWISGIMFAISSVMLAVFRLNKWV